MQQTKKRLNITKKFESVRITTEQICEPLQEADYNLQPMEDVSPAKWHLAHTTWFFETFVLEKFKQNYKIYNQEFHFLFNSYYEHKGKRLVRNARASISRPSVAKVLAYRNYVNEQVLELLNGNSNKELCALVVLGCQHEQQHQELLYTDLKYSLSVNPTFPVYKESLLNLEQERNIDDWLEVEEGIYSIGYQGNEFCFDNELGVHRVFLEPYRIQKSLVTNQEFLHFIEDGGYSNFKYWLSEGWEWVKRNSVSSPLYWHKEENQWLEFTLGGLRELPLNKPVVHLNLFEADAFACWSGKRLPTEFEWEIASRNLDYGYIWEWTNSAYLPYPGFITAEGAVGEYNGKWMVNQKVLRGGSVASSKNHIRPTYRNFFHADKQWQFTGIRLAESINL